MKQERVCFLCGRNGAGDPLDEHHIFNASNRKKSDKLGLTVYLCHERCHIFGKYAVHHNAYVMDELKRYAQREFMMREGVGIVEFRLMFGKSYIGEDEGEIVTLFDLPVQERERAMSGRDVEDAVPYKEESEEDALWESAKREYRMSMDAVKAAITYDDSVLLPY